MNQCHFFVPIWRCPMTWPTQFSFRGFSPLLQQFGGSEHTKTPKVSRLRFRRDTCLSRVGSTDTWLLQPEFQTAQQTVSLQINSLLSIFCWGTTHSCISAAVCSAGLSCSRQSSRINTTPGPTVAAAWEVPTSSSWIYDTAFFEDGGHNEIRDSWWIMFINSFSWSTFHAFWCAKVHPPGVGDSSTRRWARRRLRRLGALEVLGAMGAEVEVATESLGWTENNLVKHEPGKWFGYSYMFFGFHVNGGVDQQQMVISFWITRVL